MQKKVKVQSFGLNKTVLLNLHKDLVAKILARGYEVDDDTLNTLAEIANIHASVILFGVEEIKEKTTHTNAIREHFGDGYKGLNDYIDKIATDRSYKPLTRFVVDAFKNFESILMREIEKDKNEEEFLLLLALFENFIRKFYTETLLPILKDYEKKVKDKMIDLYNQDLNKEKAISILEEFLNSSLEDAVDLISKTADKLEDKAVSSALEGLAIFGLALPSNIIQEQKTRFRLGLISNIKGYFGNSFRRFNELFVDNIYSGSNKRSLATDQLKEISFNENYFNLSILTHYRGLFKSLIYQGAKDKTQYFKALVPKEAIPSLSPSGYTKSILFLIKTKDEWDKTKDLVNVNVVDGLGLHHNSLEYYKPVLGNLEKELALSKNQRITL